MRTGLCPKCGARAVYSREVSPSNFGSLLSSLALVPASAYESYLCRNCGYSELFSHGVRLIDSESVAQAVVTNQQWKRVDAGVLRVTPVECPKCGARLRGAGTDCSCGTSLTSLQR